VSVVTYRRWEQGKTQPQPYHRRQLRTLLEEKLGASDVPLELQVFSEPSPQEEESALLSEQDDPSESQQPSGASGVSIPPPPPTTSILSADTNVAETDEPQAFITTNMTTHLWSLAFADHPTCNDKRNAIRQALKEFDIVGTTNKNYQITRREALCSLATLPLMTLGLTTPGKIVQSTQYGSALAHCAASVEACWELYRSSDAGDAALAFQCASKYVSLLYMISKDSSHHREEALALATQYALLKTLLGWNYAGPTASIHYARDAVLLSKETGDISLQLSAYNKLANTYFHDKKYTLALASAQEAEALLQQYGRLSNAEPLYPSLQGGIYSTLALMQVKNGKSPDVAVGKATAIDPGDEIYAGMDFTRSGMLLSSGWIYCYQGNQTKAREILEKRIDPQTFAPRIAQSEMGRVETLNVLALSSLKTKDRDREQTLHFWTAAIEGAKALQSEYNFTEAVTTYEHMAVVWPGEPRIAELQDLIIHW
jgi:hypothetical protein